MNHDVEQLRAELKSLGYLSRGIERWFALDPWSSRTFWAELLLMTLKAAVIVAPFAALAPAIVMLVRNRPLPLYDTLVVLMIYVITGFVAAAAVVLAAAALFRIRPMTGIERPGALLGAALLISALLVAVIIFWWMSFPAAPGVPEFIAVAASLIVLMAIGTIAFSAALLSFSIHETQQIPSIHKRPLAIPLAAAGAALLVTVVVAVPAARSEAIAAESQVVVAPTSGRVALIAVDGLTRDILSARPNITTLLPHQIPFAPLSGSAPAVWATIGTGTSPDLHGVRAVEAVRLSGSDRVIQSISAADLVLGRAAPAIALARLQPLPPTARERHYIWELLSSRGVNAAAINWWTSTDRSDPNLRAVSQESIFQAGAGTSSVSPLNLALGIDRVALERLTDATSRNDVRFATVYLPAFDILLNRLDIPDAARVAGSVRALEQIDASISPLALDWFVVLVGTDFVASNRSLSEPATALDVAPTILDLFGFPASEEMRGRSLVTGSRQARVRSFGSRRLRQDSTVDEDYYEKLRALGYIR